jgi:lysophospholipase L1-like esterase
MGGGRIGEKINYPARALENTGAGMSHLVFIGDSLTQWCDWERRFPEHAVTNLGISGETVEGLLARRESVRARLDRPDFIFLMTGINNLANERPDILAPYREIVRNLTTWYTHATVVVQSILPVGLTWIGNDAIKDVNRRIERIACTLDAHYLDIYSHFLDEEGNPKRGYLSEDGVHLANKGYDVWAAEVKIYLKTHGRIPQMSGRIRTRE